MTEATVARWLKHPARRSRVDDPVVELETDKVTLEVRAPAAGTLTEILAAEGANVPVGAVLGRIGDGAAKPAAAKPGGGPVARQALPRERGRASGAGGAERPLARSGEGGCAATALERSGPAVRKLVAESGARSSRRSPRPARTAASPRPTCSPRATAARREPAAAADPGARAARRRASVAAERETRVRMTRLRRRIAERLKEAQNTAAMLTTFNEMDMSGRDGAARALARRLREEARRAARLHVVLRQGGDRRAEGIPAVNAEIDGDDIVYKNHYDIGVAVGTEQGLVVPVVRDADRHELRRDREGRSPRSGTRRATAS